MMTSLERRNALKGNELAWYERMLEIREFERRTNELFAAGLIRGTTHLCVGQEALDIGLATTLNPDDVLAAGLLPTSAIIGGGIPIAVGAALAFQVQKKKNVGVALFGDAATNIGAFHESLNLAAIWKLPVIFVIDNNVYGEYTRIDLSTPIEDLHLRAASYAMPSIKVDGMDVYAVQASMQEAVDRARRGDGPTLVEAKTYRFSGHSRADQALYRPAGELEHWQKRDPILLTELALIKKGILDQAKIEAMKTKIVNLVDSAITQAQADPEPSVKDMFSNVFKELRK